MVRWLRWHCPPDTGFEIRALVVWGRARYLSVTKAPHNTDFHTWMGKKPRTLAWKAAVLTTTLVPPPGISASTRRWHGVGLMLGQRRRRWVNNNSIVQEPRGVCGQNWPRHLSPIFNSRPSVKKKIAKIEECIHLKWPIFSINQPTATLKPLK